MDRAGRVARLGVRGRLIASVDTDLAAVVSRDHDSCRSRSARAAVRPVTAKRSGGEIRRGRFARMLDVDEERFAVGRFRDTRDLALFGSDQEPSQSLVARLFADVSRHRAARRSVGVRHETRLAVADLAWDRRQHHAVRDVRVRAVIGLYPQQAGVRTAEPQPVGAGEIVVVA